MGRNLATKIANLAALRLGQIGGRGAFHHLLVAPLHRTIAFIEVIDIAMAVAQDLHLNMARAGDHLFKIPLAIAKGGFCLAAAFANFCFKLVFAKDWAHTAPAAAP